MVLLATGLLVAVMAGAPADVKGKWEGTLTGQRPDGTTNEDAVLLILEQKGSTVTGTVGGNESDQHPITKGTIEGNKLTLHATNTQSGREYDIALTVQGDVMKGTVVSGDRKGQISVKKRKE